MLKSDLSMGSVGWAQLNLLNCPNKLNMKCIPKPYTQIADLQYKFAKLFNDYRVLNDNYNEAIRKQKDALEKCIHYQNEIMELQDKYSKLQEEYIKLTHYVFGNDSDNEEINKIKIA